MDILKKIEKNECKFGRKIENNICSDNNVIKMMEDMLKKLSYKNIGHEPLEIIKKSNEITNCNSESCIISSKPFIKLYGEEKAETIKRKLFKPYGPWDDNSWLSNSNIDEVVNQWVEIYPGHHHFDFKMRDNLKQINISREYKRGMNSFSIVVNTDITTGNGIHWFCIFGEFKDDEITIEYFNSSGELPLPETHEWLVLTKNNLEKNIKDKKIEYIIVSKLQLQKSSSECGVFSLWYIWLRLNEYPYNIINEPSMATDKIMYQFRTYIFRKCN